MDSAIERALSSKPRAIQQHFETTALSEINRVFERGKNCRNRFCWKNLPGRKRELRDAMTSISRGPGTFEQFNSISIIAIHSDGGHRT
jgi:hypothetical protein